MNNIVYNRRHNMKYWIKQNYYFVKKIIF
jgi:hypothetical protein